MNSHALDVIRNIVECDSNDDLMMIEVSSLKMLQVIMALDEEGISLPFDKVSHLKSIGDVIKLIDELK